MHASKAKVLFFLIFSTLLFSLSLLLFFYYSQLAEHYKFRPAIKSQCRKAINLMGVGPRETIHWPFGSTSGCNLVIYYCAEQNKKKKKGTRKKGEARERVAPPVFAGSGSRAQRADLREKFTGIHMAITTYIYTYISIYFLYLFGFLPLLVPSSGLFICLLCSMQAAKEQIAGRDALIICIRSCQVLTACRRSHRRSR